MRDHRLQEWLGHMREAATDACGFVAGLDKADFFADRRTQQAVIMSLVIIGEAATKVMDHAADFAAAHPTIPWRNIRGMRNRITHGYFDINLDLVWETVRVALPRLLANLPSVHRDAATGPHPSSENGS